MYLVMVRHGESIWNKDQQNKFAGWSDVELSEKGIDEAINAGMMLATTHIQFSVAYTSVLKRAKDTLKYIEDYVQIPEVIEDYHYNERHYGALQGLNRDETKAKYGEELVQSWRRSYDVRPPLVDESDERFPSHSPLYTNIPKEKLPKGESLKDTLMRVKEVFGDVLNRLKRGENVLIVAHGNSIRAIVKEIENISDEDIVGVEIPTGRPLIYEFDNDLKIINKILL